MVAKGELPAGSAFQVSDQQENYEGLGHYKIHPRKETTSTVNPTDNYYNSWRIYRYADVLLLAVELDVRINGTASADAQGWFDQVRDRAFKDKEHRINLAGRASRSCWIFFLKSVGMSLWMKCSVGLIFCVSIKEQRF